MAGLFRRQRQWHVPYWFFWYWRTSRCVPTIARSLQRSAQSMLRLLTRGTWKSVLFSTCPLYLSDMFSGRHFARVDFLEPSGTHTCEFSGLGGRVPESPGVATPQVTRYRECTIKSLAFVEYTLRPPSTRVRKQQQQQLRSNFGSSRR